MKYFDTLGVMLDCSRNAVMEPAALKRFMEVLAGMGYNQFQLYMEDTYEVEGEPYFGYLRGRYTKEELKDLDNYAFGLGIELVPCVQTLAHLNQIMRWPEYAAIRDTNDILLAGEERTYLLIRRMFTTLRECFRTEKIHIGMDEAHGLGRGKYLDLHGPENPREILLRHLNRVCALAEEFHFKPMMWSDMFYRLANGGEYYRSTSKFDPSIRAMIPENLSLVYWDYYHSKKSDYTGMIRGHRQLTDRIVFAGGAWEWSGFTPHNAFSIRATKAAFSACIGEGLRNAIITIWGDNGAEASPFSVLPTLCYAACLADGITAPEEIHRRFEECTGVSWQDFMLLELPDKTKNTHKIINPGKWQLYNDCFMGIMEPAVDAEDAKKYASFARRLARAEKRAGEYAYLFESAFRLCRALSVKSAICTETREVYARRDPAELQRLIRKYTRMIRETEGFYRAFRAEWYREKKPHGFDVQDQRLGGLLQRMRNCKERLEDLAAGRIASIPELEETLLPFKVEACRLNEWKHNVSTNVI